MVLLLGILGMRTFKNILLQSLSFLISVLVAASLAGFIELVQGTILGVLVVLVSAVCVVIALAVIFGLGLVRKIGDWLSERLEE